MPINQLQDVNGEGTTLVSLLLPADYKISQANQMLVEEISESQNIKDKNTRKKVEKALKKARSQLKKLGEIPENGAAIYTKHDKAVTHIPEKELNQKLYRCDNKFHVEPILELERDDTRYGIIQADRDYYRVGMADKTGNTTRLREGTSGIPSKHSKGGQSAQRWERYRAEKKKNYVREVSDTAQKHFLKKLRNNELLGIIIAGTLNREIKNQLNQELTEKIVAETGETQNLDKAFRQVKDNLKNRNELELEKVSEEFLTRLATEPTQVAYGREEVKKAAEMDAVEHMICPEGQYV